MFPQLDGPHTMARTLVGNKSPCRFGSGFLPVAILSKLITGSRVGCSLKESSAMNGLKPISEAAYKEFSSFALVTYIAERIGSPKQDDE